MRRATWSSAAGTPRTASFRSSRVALELAVLWARLPRMLRPTWIPSMELPEAVFVGLSRRFQQRDDVTAEEAGFHTVAFPIRAGAVGRLPAMEVKLKGDTANTNPSSGRCSM